MKIDFSKIEDYYSDLTTYKKETLLCFKQLKRYYELKSVETIEKLKEIFNFYNYKNSNLFQNLNLEIPELKLVYSGSEFSINLLLSYKDGVSNAKENFGTIINNPELDLDLKFESAENEDKFYEKVWEYNFVVLHIWIACLWQHFKFSSCGLKVNISDGQCVDFFYLNDMNWKENSIVTKTDKYPIENLSSTDLTPFDIFLNLKSNKRIFCEI